MHSISMNPLVSIIISTYNSSSFIIEALDSVFRQTWKGLELIITDDCSSDATVELCRGWLENKRQRFDRVEMITSAKNTGVPANANRGLNAAKGEWIKFLGADDTLEPGCIEDNVEWIKLHPEIKVLFSQIKVYTNSFYPENLLEIIPHNPYDPKGIFAPGRSASTQYNMLLISDRIHFTPSIFLNREVLLSLGGFDEKYRLFEDYPLWLNLTKNGYKLYIMDRVTVDYRRHSRAINNSDLNYLIKPNYFRSENFRKDYIYPHLPSEMMLSQRFQWFVTQVFHIKRLNKDSKPNRALFYLLTVYMNPFRYYHYIKKRLIKSVNDNEFYM